MKRCLIFALLLVFLLTGCFEMHPPASTAPPRTEPPETTAAPTEEVTEPVGTEPWDPWADFEKIGMEKYPGLEASEMPDFDSVVSICLRNGTDFSEVMITDEAEIEYILSQIPPVLEQTCVKDDFEGWTYMLILLDAEGNEVTRIWKIMTVGISFDGYNHVSDCREFNDYLGKYFGY